MKKTENSVYCNSDRAGSAYRATFGMKWYNKNKEEEKTAEEEASTIYFPKWTLTRSQHFLMRLTM